MGLTKSKYIDYLITQEKLKQSFESDEDTEEYNLFDDLSEEEIEAAIDDILIYDVIPHWEELSPFSDKKSLEGNGVCKHVISDFPMQIKGYGRTPYYFCKKCGELMKIFIP